MDTNAIPRPGVASPTFAPPYAPFQHRQGLLIASALWTPRPIATPDNEGAIDETSVAPPRRAHFGRPKNPTTKTTGR